MKDMITSFDKESLITVTDEHKIMRNAKKRKVFNVLQKKNYKITYNKRVLKENFLTVPYGY